LSDNDERITSKRRDRAFDKRRLDWIGKRSEMLPRHWLSISWIAVIIVFESGSTMLSTILRQKRVNVISSVECQRRWDQGFMPVEIAHTNLCIDEGVNGDISACFISRSRRREVTEGPDGSGESLYKTEYTYLLFYSSVISLYRNPIFLDAVS
ncbi:hypothetical protein LSH36_1086g00000, partial [Paralvinella palmiformis]